MSAKECPKCGLFNPDSATRCDCGWDFAERVQRRAPARSTASAAAPISTPTTVTVTDIDIPFPSMVRLIFKWSLASLPVILIFVLIGYLLGIAYYSLNPTSRPTFQQQQQK